MNQYIEIVVQVWLSFCFINLSLVHLDVMDLSIHACLTFNFLSLFSWLVSLAYLFFFRASLSIYKFDKRFVDENVLQILFIDIIHEQFTIFVHYGVEHIYLQICSSSLMNYTSLFI